MGMASPISVWPLAFSTFGLLNRLKRDILELLRSIVDAGLSEFRVACAGVDCRFCSSKFALDRLRRQREVEKVSLGAMASLACRAAGINQHMNVAGWRKVNMEEA